MYFSEVKTKFLDILIWKRKPFFNKYRPESVFHNPLFWNQCLENAYTTITIKENSNDTHLYFHVLETI